ncbi:hypothetical protein [Micromonospora sp. NPDC049662]|uniref:hypothetical protein n=1 Tax=Micromonospora sp. NPDC049662 TaxID=3155397 RepID=UPI0034485087
MKMVVAVDEALPERIEDAVRDEQARERAWLVEQRRDRGIDGMKAGQRRAAIAQLYADRAARREAQEVLATRSALVSAHLSRLLEAAGWGSRAYPPVPGGQDTMPGRRWGTSGYGHHRGGPGRLTIVLPQPLGERVRRVSYWVSQRATVNLQRYADESAGGFPPLDLLREMGDLAVDLYLLPLEQLAAAVRRRTRAEPGPIVSTGDLVRAAAYRATRYTPAPDQRAASPT